MRTLAQAISRILPGLLAAALVLLVVLPLFALLLSVPPAGLIGILTDPEVQDSLRVTLLAGSAATIVALPSGIALAYLLARSEFRGKRLVEAIVDLPVVIPHTAAGVALLLVFGRKGWIGGFLTPLGITFTDNVAGAALAMIFVSLPLLINPSREAFAQTSRELEESAQVDGASQLQTFWRVTFPQARRGVLAGILMMWARGISEFGAVAILAYYPKIIPVLVYERFNGFGLSAAMPVAVLLLLPVLAIFLLLRFFVK